jgi:hypothetical protein
MGDATSSPQNLLGTQWTEPGDIFSVLLILGGDVIQLSCAALAGNPGLLPAPIAFSFGWVSYAMSAVLSAIGENRILRCAPKVDVKVINLKTGYAQSNRSWVLGRLVKTYPCWMPEIVRESIMTHCVPAAGSWSTTGEPASQCLPFPTSSSHAASTFESHVGFCVAVYDWKQTPEPSYPKRDWVWWSGYAASILQLGARLMPSVTCPAPKLPAKPTTLTLARTEPSMPAIPAPAIQFMRHGNLSLKSSNKEASPF